MASAQSGEVREGNTETARAEIVQQIRNADAIGIGGELVQLPEHIFDALWLRFQPAAHRSEATLDAGNASS